MKEKNRIRADKHTRLSMQHLNTQDPVHSDQAVDKDKQAEIRELCEKKFSEGHEFERVKCDKKENVRPEKKHGSHSLSQLHFFQNHHK